MNDHMLALDQGTSSSRAIVFHRDGRIVASAQREFRQIFPQPGWVEHDANEIWDTQLAVAREALAASKLAARDIAAVGITNQRETTLLWNRRTGQPIANAIVWQDRRTEPLCAQLRAAGLAEQVRASTGLVIDPYFSGTKIRWLLDHVSGAHVAAARGELAFGTIDSWLLWKLTGGRVHATDVSNASRTMLFDIRHNVWDHELLKALHVPDSLLPKVLPSSHRYADTDPALFGAPIPIAGIAGDQQSALFGQACFTPGLAKNTYGTGCFMLMHTGERLPHVDARAGHHQRGADQHERAAVRARRQRLRRRCGGAVAARRPGRHQVEQRRAGAGDERARCRRRDVRAGLHRPRRAVLERRRARRDRRLVARLDGGAHRARGAREHRAFRARRCCRRCSAMRRGSSSTSCASTAAPASTMR